MIPATRKEALALGVKHFFTGRSCSHGHTATRFASDKKCTECNKEKAAARYAADPSKIIAKTTAYRRKHIVKNRLRAAAYARAYYAKNRERAKTATKNWRTRNKNHLRQYSAKAYAKNGSKYALAWKRANPEKNREISSRRRARRLAQICECCSTADVRRVYVACSPGHEVDHIRPLALGGLHCKHNLQILTIAEHRKKTANDIRRIRGTA